MACLFGNLSSSICAIALKWHPVVSRSSKTTSFSGAGLVFISSIHHCRENSYRTDRRSVLGGLSSGSGPDCRSYERCRPPVIIMAETSMMRTTTTINTLPFSPFLPEQFSTSMHVSRTRENGLL